MKLLSNRAAYQKNVLFTLETYFIIIFEDRIILGNCTNDMITFSVSNKKREDQ